MQACSTHAPAARICFVARDFDARKLKMTSLHCGLKKQLRRSSFTGSTFDSSSRASVVLPNLSRASSASSQHHLPLPANRLPQLHLHYYFFRDRSAYGPDNSQSLLPAHEACVPVSALHHLTAWLFILVVHPSLRPSTPS